MIKITLICVGKLKESYFRDAVAEYSKRLQRYCDLTIIEVPDEKTPDNASDADNDKIKNTEGTKIIDKIPERAYVFTLEINGKMNTSEALSEMISLKMNEGYSHLCFIIGGSLGLSDMVINKSNYHLSFSKMTFPHQLMRVVLLEQLYRCFKIMSNEPYHK